MNTLYRSNQDLTLPIMGAVFLLASVLGAYTPSFLTQLNGIDDAITQVGWLFVAAIGLFATFLAVTSLLRMIFVKINSISLDFERDSIQNSSYHLAKISDVTAIEIHKVQRPTKISSDVFALSVTLYDGRIVGVYSSLSAQNVEQIGKRIAAFTGKPVPSIR